jgi:drug/metabolite transporter (DMT)-like permease
MGATRASATAFLIPVVALILGVVVRREDVRAVAILGAAISLLGAWLIRRAHKRSESKATANLIRPVPAR